MEITKEMLDLASANANHDQLRVMYDAMKAERDALAAQLTMVRKIFRDESLSASETLRKIPFVIDLAPEQCIAELRAQAGRAGYLKGADDWKSFDQVFDLDINRAADEYADSIRRGG